MDTNSAKLMNDVCLVSRQGVCLLDMKQVQEKAEQMGLTRLAQIVASDLAENKIVDGQYFPIVSFIYGG